MTRFLEKLSKKERVGLFIAALFVAVVLIDRVILVPINNKLRQLDLENKAVEKQLSALLRTIKSKDSIPKEYQKYAQYIRKTGSDEEEVARMLSEIEELAHSSNVLLADMKPQPAKAMGAYREYSIEVNGEGDEESITKFLYKLNNSLQLLRAEKVNLYLKDKNSPIVKTSMLITKLVTS